MIQNLVYANKAMDIPLDSPTNLSAAAGNAKVRLMWTDPLDKYAVPGGESLNEGDQLVSQWEYTRIVRKPGSQPTGPNDGTHVVESTVRNQYQDTPYIDEPVLNDTTYYYAAYAYNTDGVASEAAFFNAATPKQFDPVLENNTWEQISEVSDSGTGSSAWSIGDTKSVLINGTIGSRVFNQTFYVFIIGFDHNAAVEGAGITFHGFKNAGSGGKDVCLVGSDYGSNKSPISGNFVMNVTATNTTGGWVSSDMRSHCLGSENASSPTANTLMAALPDDLRVYMKPMTIWTNNTKAGVDSASASIDYLPLLSEYEVFGTIGNSVPAEAQHQQQYAYYSSGNSKVKYRYDLAETAANWWERSPRNTNNFMDFCAVSPSGTAGGSLANSSYGVSPIFRI